MKGWRRKKSVEVRVGSYLQFKNLIFNNRLQCPCRRWREWKYATTIFRCINITLLAFTVSSPCVKLTRVRIFASFSFGLIKFISLIEGYQYQWGEWFFFAFSLRFLLLFSPLVSLYGEWKMKEERRKSPLGFECSGPCSLRWLKIGDGKRPRRRA